MQNNNTNLHFYGSEVINEISRLEVPFTQLYCVTFYSVITELMEK